MRRLAAMVLIAGLAAGTARALEVSLEENKAQRGSIGFVDTQKLFRMYPETQKAKQSFEEVLRQAEEQVNLRKAELIGLRADVIKLRLERDAAAKLAAGIQAAQPLTPPPPQTPPAPATPPQAPAASTGAVTQATPAPGATLAVATSTGAATLAVQSSTGAASAATATPTAATATVSGQPGVLGSTAPVTLVPVSTPTATATAPKEEGAPLIINLPGLSPEPMVMQPPAEALQAAKSLTDLENRLAEKTRLLQDKEAEFKVYQAQVEKNLLDLEDKKTEILLGKIYKAVQEVAREEGVSVVVDRTQILFGQNAMDLTEKVIKKLKSQS